MMEAELDNNDEFTFPIDRSALTLERRDALKRFAALRARAERPRTIREMMAWFCARLRRLRVPRA